MAIIKRLRDAGEYLQNVAKAIDENPKIKTDARKKRRMQDEWNWHLSAMEDTALNNTGKALIRIFYNMLGSNVAQSLTWVDFKKLVNGITSIMKNLKEEDWQNG